MDIKVVYDHDSRTEFVGIRIDDREIWLGSLTAPETGDVIANYEAAVKMARLIAAAPQLLEALGEVQWSASYLRGDDFDSDWNQEVCPICGSHELEGHEKDCKLKAALVAVKGGA
jgi:hypothetical protein